MGVQKLFIRAVSFNLKTNVKVMRRPASLFIFVFFLLVLLLGVAYNMYLHSGGWGRESFDATNSDALGAIRSSSGSKDERMAMEMVSGAPISTIMTPMGSVRACGSVNTLCGTRDGYYAGNLIVGENMGVTGNININGSIKEVQDMSVLRALNVNGMAKLESVNLRSGEDLRVIGDATVQKMTVEGDTHVGGTLAVDKHVNMKGDAEVHGDMRGMKGVDVNNGVRVGKTFHVKGDVFLNKSCMHEDDLYTMGSAGAMGDMLVGKNLGTGKDHIVAGSGVVAGSTMVGRNLDVADNMDVLTNVSIGGDLNVSQGANLKGNVSLIGPGGSVYVTGGSVLLGARKGATPPDTRGVHVRRLNGKTTSFCVDKHNVIDGDTMLQGDICWGGGNNLCLNEPKIVDLLNLENLMSTSISNAERVIRNDRELRTSGANSLFVRASNDMSSHENVFSSDTKNLGEFDRRARSDLTSHGEKQELQKLAIVRVDNKNKVQESRLTRLEALLKRVELRAFNILKDSATNACDKKKGAEPKTAKVSLWENHNSTGGMAWDVYKVSNTPYLIRIKDDSKWGFLEDRASSITLEPEEGVSVSVKLFANPPEDNNPTSNDITVYATNQYSYNFGGINDKVSAMEVTVRYVDK